MYRSDVAMYDTQCLFSDDETGAVDSVGKQNVVRYARNGQQTHSNNDGS